VSDVMLLFLLQSLETQASISLGLGMLVHQVDDLQGK
jgi:hypothetical protein